jgi:hypothetical protein
MPTTLHRTVPLPVTHHHLARAGGRAGASRRAFPADTHRHSTLLHLHGAPSVSIAAYHHNRN